MNIKIIACQIIGPAARSRRVCRTRSYGPAKTRAQIEPNFLAVDVRDVITPFKFGDDRSRGLGLAEGQILPFPIDHDDVLTTLSHYCVSV